MVQIALTVVEDQLLAVTRDATDDNRCRRAGNVPDEVIADAEISVSTATRTVHSIRDLTTDLLAAADRGDAVEGGAAIPREMVEMTNWDTRPAVEHTPGKVSGARVVAGTQAPLSAPYENLAGGATVGEFVAWFSGVDARQVRTALEPEARALWTAPTY